MVKLRFYIDPHFDSPDVRSEGEFEIIGHWLSSDVQVAPDVCDYYSEMALEVEQGIRDEFSGYGNAYYMEFTRAGAVFRDDMFKNDPNQLPTCQITLAEVRDILAQWKTFILNNRKDDEFGRPIPPKLVNDEGSPF